MGKILSWGKCRVVTHKQGDAKWYEWNTPVDGSTTVNTTKGDKKEAKIEGGENEAVRYGKNTYQLLTSIRLAAGMRKPLPDTDGVVDGDFEVAVIPEAASAVGILIQSSAISLEDTFSSEEGIQLTYAFDALTAPSGDQLKYGTFDIKGSGAETDISKASTFTFTEVQDEGASGAANVINLIGGSAS